ncbi:hypothetical protein J8J40_30765, partial [Mycobacterium tuberculosis]|nr:hypothetical protein [Mycobacterium tuberculosis]
MPVADQILRAATPRDIPALAAIAARSYRAAFYHILSAAELADRGTDYFADRFALTLGKVTVIER